MYEVRKVEPLPGYRLHIEFEDGVKGEIDLSEKLDIELRGAVRHQVNIANCHRERVDVCLAHE